MKHTYHIHTPTHVRSRHRAQNPMDIVCRNKRTQGHVPKVRNTHTSLRQILPPRPGFHHRLYLQRDSRWKQMNGSEWRRGLHLEFLPSSGSGPQLLLRGFSDPSEAHAWIEGRLRKGCFRETLGQSLDTGERMNHRTSCDKESTASRNPEGQR